MSDGITPRLLRTLYRDYGWVHRGIGLFGNTCFFVGSIFFLYPDWLHLGTWLFILGAGGMLIGSVGSSLVEWESSRSLRHRNHNDTDPE